MQSVANSTLLLHGLFLQVNATVASLPAEFINTSLPTSTAGTPFEELLLQNTLSLVSGAASGGGGGGGGGRRSQGSGSLQKAEFSPVTLSPEWSRMSRLLLLSALCILGSVGNIFMISSVVIEDYLKRPGNSQTFD